MFEEMFGKNTLSAFVRLDKGLYCPYFFPNVAPKNETNLENTQQQGAAKQKNS